jgi:hypothetical protein
VARQSARARVLDRGTRRRRPRVLSSGWLLAGCWLAAGFCKGCVLLKGVELRGAGVNDDGGWVCCCEYGTTREARAGCKDAWRCCTLRRRRGRRAAFICAGRERFALRTLFFVLGPRVLPLRRPRPPPGVARAAPQRSMGAVETTPLAGKVRLPRLLLLTCCVRR